MYEGFVTRADYVIQYLQMIEWKYHVKFSKEEVDCITRIVYKNILKSQYIYVAPLLELYFRNNKLLSISIEDKTSITKIVLSTVDMIKPWSFQQPEITHVENGYVYIRGTHNPIRQITSD